MQRGEALLSRVFGQTATWTAAEPATTAGGTDGAASAAEPGAAPDSASDPAALLATAFLARRAQAADLREMGLSPRRIFRRSFAELLAQDLVGTTAAFSAQLAECRLQRGRDAAAGAQDDDDDELASLNLSHLSASASNKRFVRLRRAAEACEKLMLRYDAPTAVDPRKRKPAPKIKRPATGRVAPNDGVYDGGGGDDGGAPLAGAAAFAASALAQEAAPAPAVGPAPAHAAARALFSAAASAPAPAAAVGEAASSRLLSESRLEDSLGASQSDSCALETAHSACTAPSTASTATVAEALAPPRHCAVSAGAWRSVAGRRALVRSEVAKARLRCTHPHRDVDAFAALLRPVAHLSTGALGAEAPLYVFSVLDVFSAKERRETRCAFSRLCDFFKSVNLPAAADLCDERAVKAASDPASAVLHLRNSLRLSRERQSWAKTKAVSKSGRQGTLSRGPCHADLATGAVSRGPCHRGPCHADLATGAVSRGPCHRDLVTRTLPQGSCHADLATGGLSHGRSRRALPHGPRHVVLGDVVTGPLLVTGTLSREP
ncbi:hypothetical protein M885DRAFT_206288 [Pelagophyceae sp. CCMP2097]|nr:hypothetical protein M885DRAFT_206288 [Pelagophyceae sp. CCMP2097]